MGAYNSPEDLNDKILNLEKVFELPPKNQKVIWDLYNSLLWATEKWGSLDSALGGAKSFDYVKFDHLYRTLDGWGFLITRREKNLQSLEYTEKMNTLGDRSIDQFVIDHYERTGEVIRVLREED
jgi:hypothetical protein